ncbi:MAG: enoyl-CoA hydratase/isomerase family protein [Paracoccaceae bacterium]
MTSVPVRPIGIRRDGSVMIVTIDNPLVNALSASVRAGLLDAFASIAQTPDITGVVLTGAGASFIAGADIREFGGPLIAPHLPQVIDAIEACLLPVIAALKGSALGGGFEIALACDARVALADAVVGLPEVHLGIIPGAGGMSRFPRLMVSL